MPKATLQVEKTFVDEYGRTHHDVGLAECPACQTEHRFLDDCRRDVYDCQCCGVTVFCAPPDHSLPPTAKNLTWIKGKLDAFSGVYGFPKTEPGLLMYCEEFLKIVHNEERAEWLLGEMRRMEMRRFPMPIVLRRIYDTLWTPADGLTPDKMLGATIEAEHS
jgi:hypothetical protein